MKTYDYDKVYKARWLVSQNYLPSSDALWGDFQKKLYDFSSRYPINKIIHDKENYPNPIDLSEVFYMSNNLYPFCFHPITIDKKSVLKDGQYRLELAKWFGWEFIDVLIEKEVVEKPRPDYYVI